MVQSYADSLQCKPIDPAQPCNCLHNSHSFLYTITTPTCMDFDMPCLPLFFSLPRHVHNLYRSHQSWQSLFADGSIPPDHRIPLGSHAVQEFPPAFCLFLERWTDRQVDCNVKFYNITMTINIIKKKSKVSMERGDNDSPKWQAENRKSKVDKSLGCQ